LEIALTNLLSNATKFSGNQPLPRIEFGKTFIDGKAAYFIRDNGAGFDMAFAKNLFGAFQRMHKQTEFPGSGIGLATVQRIIHRHGGKVWAEAQKDQGATFYFTLEETV
jgi:light-regulated signal transduction histidine kinase (bacteriophytochrome)